MKKLATPPQSASNHRFHSYGWSRALNYVAKAYLRRGQIDTSPAAHDAVLTDITLQYEAMHWAEKVSSNNDDTDLRIPLPFYQSTTIRLMLLLL